MSRSIKTSFAVLVLVSFALLMGCGFSGEGSASPPHSLGGQVTGLSGKLTLFAAGMVLTIAKDGSFAFPNLLADGQPYDILVLEAPPEQRCGIQNGSGVMAGANVTNIAITCGKGLFAVGGVVSGLQGKLTLQNGSSFLNVEADGMFKFSDLVPDGAGYAVKVYKQPDGQSCVVAKDAGLIASADVTDVVVSCDVDDARLVDLELSQGALTPAFSPETSLYWADLGLLLPTLTVTPTAVQKNATITVNGQNVVSGSVSQSIPLSLGSNFINVHVAVPSGATRDYAVLVNRDEGLASGYIKASNTEANDQFGHSVAIFGDTLVVGAPFEDSGAKGINGDQNDSGEPNSGAVYVYRRNGDAWVQEAYIKASNTDSNDGFGSSVALSGDTLVVAAPGEDSDSNGVDGNQNNEGESASGAVYVFFRAGNVWAQQAYIKASNSNANDAFGTSLSLSGETLAVGAIGEDSNATGINGNDSNDSLNDSGAVYVFVRSMGKWSQQAYIKGSTTDFSDAFGASVALSADTLAVGANAEDSNAVGVGGDEANDSANDSGAVYVFVRAAGVWSQQAYLKASNTDATDQFGLSLALVGDTLAVGAPYEDGGASGVDGDDNNNQTFDSGAVYVFGRNGQIWTQSAYVKASNTHTTDFFGRSLALSAETLVVGAPSENSNAIGVNGSQGDLSMPDAGAAYLFGRVNGAFSQIAYVKPPNTESYDNFGGSVAVFGDSFVCSSEYEDSDAKGAFGNPYSNGANGSGAVFVLR